MSTPSSNVTLAEDLTALEQSIPCFLCRDSLVIKRDKNQKPYFICEVCGIQAFIRRKQGIRLLKELQDNSFSSLKLIQLTRELTLLKSEKDKITSQRGVFGLFAPDEELIKAEFEINQKTQEITQKIKKLGENSTTGL